MNKLTQYQFAALIIALVGLLLALARRLRIPDPMMLFAVGVASTAIPGLPRPTVDPDMVLTLFLPPLLYASTVRVTPHLLRFTLWPGVLLGAVLVVATIAAVVVSARFVFLPGLGWPAALLIGIVAALSDTRLFDASDARNRVPRAIRDTLKARELVARILILATLGLVQDGLSPGGVTSAHVLDNYAVDIPAGVLLGVVLGRAIVWLRQRIDPATIEIAVSIATPYLAALAAEAAGVSAAGAIIAAALVVAAVRVDRRSGGTISSTEARINATAFWDEASLMISSVLFLLAGRAMPEALRALEVWSPWQVAATAAGILATALAVQFGFSLLSARMAPIAPALQRSGRSASAAAAVMTWSSTRSVIGLLVALSVPAALPDGSPFRERDLILALATFVVVGSVLIQGLSLRFVANRAALCDSPGEDEEEALAKAAIAKEADTAGGPDREGECSPGAARRKLLELREKNVIGDEVMTRMMRETDLRASVEEREDRG